MTLAPFELGPQVWALLIIAAIFVGVSKTGIPGINTISIAIFAALLPAKASTGALLLLLIVGDAFALLSYRRDADWKQLIKLIPFVLLGLAFGGFFLAFASDGSVGKIIGIILLGLIALTMVQRYKPSSTRNNAGVSAAGGSAPRADAAPAGILTRAGYGAVGGFTTMVANAGGPVMSLYFLAVKLPMKTFLGTAAWFFAVTNIIKLPVSIGLGLITPETLVLDMLLIPGVVAGAILGRFIISKINQKTFDWAVIIFTTVGALYLLLK